MRVYHLAWMLAGWMICLTCLNETSLHATSFLYLRDNLHKAQSGNYLVVAQNKTYTLLNIYEHVADSLVIEEITVSAHKIPQGCFDWKNWVRSGAPGHVSWVLYPVNLQTGDIDRFFSVSKNGWFRLTDTDHFLATLLSLRFVEVPSDERKRVGPPPTDTSLDYRPLWQPQMIVEGRKIKGVQFNAWRTVWPRDNTLLSNKTIEVFLPADNQPYPNYFPYWLQVRGMVGKAQVHIIDSGSHLISPVVLHLEIPPQTSPNG